MTRVPFLDLGAATAELQADLEHAAQRVIRSGWYILGEEVQDFESEFAAYCGARRCVGVGNGLDAIALLLRAHGIGAGDEVIVPAFTFIASWLGVTYAGATPVPAPCVEATANLDPQHVAEAITPRTRAILAVHLYGQPADMTALRAVADEHSVLLLEDAAQAHGAKLHGRHAGTLGDGAAFSFYPGKNLGALGDAGAVVTDDAALADRVVELRNYGSARKYVHDEQGVNSRLDELQAALLRVKLHHLDDWNARRRAVADRYLAELRGVALPEVIDGAEPVWHLFVVRHDDRDVLQRRLAEAGIGTLIHYPSAPHETSAYAGLHVRPEHVEVAARTARRVLSLPIGPHMTAEQTTAVISAVASAT